MAADGTIDDLANWPLNGQEDIFGKGQKFSSPVAGTWIIGLNSRKAPFNDSNVRHSFKLAFDSESFRKKFYPDAEKASAYIPPGFPGHNDLNILNRSPKIVSRDQVIVAIPDGLANGEAIAKFITENYRKLGWNVKTLIMPWAKLMKRYENKSLQAFLVSMNVDYPDSEFLLRNFESRNLDNFSGMRDPKFDELLARARSSVDRLTREALYKIASARVEDFAATINLFYPRAHAWVSKCVEGFEPNLLSDVYITYGEVSLDPSCVGERQAL
jgi:ABC-type transport system substrate-binding protein